MVNCSQALASLHVHHFVKDASWCHQRRDSPNDSSGSIDMRRNMTVGYKQNSVEEQTRGGLK